MNEPHKKQNPIITAGRVLSALCLLLAVALAANSLPAAFADEKGVLTYTLSGNGATITKCAADATSEDVEKAFGAPTLPQ